MKNENVLVCVSNHHNAAPLIARGMQEKKAFQGECYVLHVYEPDEGDNLESVQQRDHIQAAADDAGAVMIFQPRKKGCRISEMIGETARRNEIEHLIIGQTVKSRWDLMIHGSLVNELFHELDDVDVTIYKVKRTSAETEAQHDKGVPGYLYKDGNTYKVALSDKPFSTWEGTFYQNLHTDFRTGTFKGKVGEEPVVLHVIQGEVAEQHHDRLTRIIQED
ncbi:hypothetical protein [Alkalicoccus urumqiensis]|uniref:UspA domain-containing protein n=1 Tax=Alkalicoccus urumqiensis TaxID=1548213 RepID=A0A2P6MJ28_ALKUR|nr:hypothetical protein [Alkalicoccus urumqiensis]PRO66281.1 hypothetical protein C6I21_05625 [Alkalicoccus urumqiensis]